MSVHVGCLSTRLERVVFVRLREDTRLPHTNEFFALKMMTEVPWIRHNTFLYYFEHSRILATLTRDNPPEKARRLRGF